MQQNMNPLQAALTQICADVDELIPQFQAYVDHYKNVALIDHNGISVALAVIEGSNQLSRDEIEGASSGDILAALQLSHHLSSIAAAISIFSEDPTNQLAVLAGHYSTLIRSEIAKNPLHQ